MPPQKYPQNVYTQKNIHFSETLKNLEIQKFDPQNMDRAYVCIKISEYPAPHPPPLGYDPASKSHYHSQRSARSILCHEQRHNDVAHRRRFSVIMLVCRDPLHNCI